MVMINIFQVLAAVATVGAKVHHVVGIGRHFQRLSFMPWLTAALPSRLAAEIFGFGLVEPVGGRGLGAVGAVFGKTLLKFADAAAQLVVFRPKRFNFDAVFGELPKPRFERRFKLLDFVHEIHHGQVN